MFICYSLLPKSKFYFEKKKEKASLQTLQGIVGAHVSKTNTQDAEVGGSGVQGYLC